MSVERFFFGGRRLWGDFFCGKEFWWRGRRTYNLIDSIKKYEYHNDDGVLMDSLLYNYLSSEYSPGEPIFYKDIEIGSSVDSLRHQFSNLVKTGKLAKYDNGTFFIPKKSLLGGTPFISSDTVAFSKYISRKDKIIGYYSGLTFANQIGATYQVPVIKEITTNECSAIVRIVVLNNKEYQIRKPKVTVTNENYKILQMLSFLENVKKYYDYEIGDISEKIRTYARNNGLTKEDLFLYAESFNNSVYKTIIEMGI